MLDALADLKKYVEELKREVDSYIYSRVEGRADSDIILRVVRGGKRLRPILLLMVFKALNGKEVKRALDVACALELAHNASLTHDDVIDGDLRRRGKPSLWRQVGIGKAVIEGHRIINLAFQIALDEGMEIARIFLRAWDRASSGVLRELMHRDLPTKTLYMRIIREKTASLFEAAAESGALLAGASPDAVKAAKRYGDKVGVAYQLADDYVDIVRGRLSLRFPIILYQRIEERLRQAFISLRLRRFSALFKLFSARIDWERFLLDELVKALRDASRTVDEMGVEEPHKSYLREFPLYCVNSMLAEVGVDLRKLLRRRRSNG